MESTTRLLDELSAYFRRFVVVTPEQGLALALWTMHTYVYDAGDTTPYLVISSAEKRSGKTRLLECLNAVVREPLFTSSMTEAALFRSIDKWKPTMLIDETDALFKNGNREPSERQEAIRSLLNSGFRRGSYTIRCEGQGANQTVARYEIYCPKALAGIGHLPDTIRDRGLPIRLQRRTRDEQVEAFRFRVGAQLGPVFVDQLASWAAVHEVGLQRAEPPMPGALDDRAQDAYELLVAIAALAGEEWQARSVDALVSLRGEDQAMEAGGTSHVLSDLGGVLEYLSGRFIATADLLALLYEHGEHPWSEWWGEASGKRASMRLAKALREYDLMPQKYRAGTGTRRGYEIKTLCALISRYVLPESEQRNIPANEEVLGRNTAEESSDPESGDLQGLFQRSDFLTRGSPEWIACASAGDLEAWKREVLDAHD